jgi:hypothetical protein
MATTLDAANIDRLNSFLRDELAAVETYREAIHGRSVSLGKVELTLCQRSHEARARALRDQIATLGGQPASSSGMRGPWERLLERGASAIADQMAFRVLERGEDYLLHDYRARVRDAEPALRTFLETKILREEVLTQHMMHDLERRLVS